MQHLLKCLGRWSAEIAQEGGHAELAPPQWMLDALDSVERETAERIRAAVLAERAACAAIAEIASKSYGNEPDDDTSYNEGASMAAAIIIAYINERPLP